MTRGVTWLVAVCAATAIAVPWYLIVQKIENAVPVESPVAATSVSWAERVFVSRPELAHWLHVRGVAYSVWASRHAAAAARIKSH